jgi:hypothetical protein
MSERIAIVQSIRAFLTDKSDAYAIADTLKLFKQVWTATKDSRDEALFEDAGNPGDYARLIARTLEQKFPVKVEIVSKDHDFEKFLYTVRFKFEVVDVPPTPAETLDDYTSSKLFAELAEALGGTAGNFSGTIRVEDVSNEQAEAIAVSYFKAVTRFCHTCSCTWRRLKGGAASIRVVVGEPRSEAA